MQQKRLAYWRRNSLPCLGWSVVLMLVLTYSFVAAQDDIPDGPIPTAILQAYHPKKGEQDFNVLPSSDFGGLASSTEGRHPLRRASPDIKGCDAFDRSLGGSYAVIARGNCSYAVKVQNAIAAGAKGVVIFDTISANYNATSTSNDPKSKKPQVEIPGSMGGACRLRCDWSSGFTFNVTAAAAYEGYPQSQCAQGCPHTKVCGLTGRPNPDASQGGWEICCMGNRWVNMQSDTKVKGAKNIPIVFASLTEGWRLLDALPDTEATVVRRPPGFPLSSCLVWLMGVGATIYGTYNAAENAHKIRRGIARRAGSRTENTPTLELTIPIALCYACMGSAFLVGLYFLLKAGERYVVLFFIVVFCLAGVGAMTALYFKPLVYSVLPIFNVEDRIVKLPRNEKMGLYQLVAVCLALGTSTAFFVLRHSPVNWILQDIIALAFVVEFLFVVRLNSIKVSTVMLVVFMVYDVFMVFISPLIFKQSVMVQVAKAGAGGETLVKDIHVCERLPNERMPMLFMVPNWSWMHGFSMLGLGDVILPGLLICFSLRYDMAKHTRPSGAPCVKYPYWSLLCGGYACGLTAALMANYLGITINGVQGQPALLYLVPFTLIPFTVRALLRKELGTMWKGPPEVVVQTASAHQSLIEMEEGESRPRDEDDGDGDEGGRPDPSMCGSARTIESPRSAPPTGEGEQGLGSSTPVELSPRDTDM